MRQLFLLLLFTLTTINATDTRFSLTNAGELSFEHDSPSGFSFRSLRDGDVGPLLGLLAHPRVAHRNGVSAYPVPSVLTFYHRGRARWLDGDIGPIVVRREGALVGCALLNMHQTDPGALEATLAATPGFLDGSTHLDRINLGRALHEVSEGIIQVSRGDSVIEYDFMGPGTRFRVCGERVAEVRWDVPLTADFRIFQIVGSTGVLPNGMLALMHPCGYIPPVSYAGPVPAVRIFDDCCEFFKRTKTSFLMIGSGGGVERCVRIVGRERPNPFFCWAHRLPEAVEEVD